MSAKSAANPSASQTPRVLYRKYRPTKLTEVVGQENVTSALANALKQGKIAHAYLFIGPRGTGKTSVARILAHTVNGFDYEIEDQYLDIIEIDAASNTGVDNIRELREKAIIAPTKGKYKVYIIDEAHMLSKSAYNALLKIFEEPPEHVIFVLATTDAHKLPITISSRAQVFNFQLAAPEVMTAHLQKIAAAEKIKITDEALALIAQRGGGSYRDALSLLGQVATLTEQEITAEFLREALGLPADQMMAELLEAYRCGDSAQIQELLKNFLESGLSPTILAGDLIAKIVAAPAPELLPLLAKLPEVKEPFPEAKLLLALLEPREGTPRPNLGATAVRTQSAQKAPRNAPERHFEQKSAKIEPEKATIAPKITPKPANPAAFSWESFLGDIQQLNIAIHNQLVKTAHEVVNEELHLYPAQNFAKKILETPGNRQILAQALPGMAIIVHEVGEPKPGQDPALSQISEIMGNIQEISENAPF